MYQRLASVRESYYYWYMVSLQRTGRNFTTKAAKKDQKRLEKRIQKRRRKYIRQAGSDISLDEFKYLEKTEIEQMVVIDVAVFCL